jgi:3-hydroxyacyl-CoA dehydrogenase
MITKNKEEIEKILKLSNKQYNCSKKSREISNKIGDILELIDPKLEDILRDGHSFLDCSEYAEATFSKKEVKKQINKALLRINKNDN